MVNFHIDPNKFKSEYFEKKFYFAKNTCFGKEIGLEDLGKLLSVSKINSPYFRLYRNGLVSEQDYIDVVNFGNKKSFLNKEKFYDLLKNGATLVLNQFEQSSVEIRNICAEIEKFINAPTVANAYLALGGDGTFGAHWDTHDVFAIQLMGRKRWKIYSPTFPLPIEGQTSLHHKSECPVEPIFDTILETGDMLYIPRGFWHHAMPTEGRTFHIAVGIHNIKFLDYIKWACVKAFPNFLECRQSLDIHQALNSQDIINLLQPIMQKIEASLADEHTFSTFLNEAKLACPKQILLDLAWCDLIAKNEQRV